MLSAVNGKGKGERGGGEGGLGKVLGPGGDAGRGAVEGPGGHGELRRPRHQDAGNPSVEDKVQQHGHDVEAEDVHREHRLDNPDLAEGAGGVSGRP